ncbi:sugar ABC transporter permease [Actinomadura sp. NPDC048955]|uniref:Multiple sugar transport system permease protein n=1 Tax=Actinomadura luteofluorescens TaxID=46163 RepID=A0A7Y9JGN8_9ACTN|nr:MULTISPECIES: sugar ABC transporter permease [Actinomadura]MCR3744353.1 carbohydrate ABC transporter membrane protein 1, CUT1 family [Actinomadura glauciflava]NUS56260.1 sugar ABC transporter permease [Streptomycetaceae bacterium]NYD47783.1 multiple sugar transport system permease protein [Actinomadura luteofluorescens]
MTSAETAPKLGRSGSAPAPARAEISDRGRAERRLGLLLSLPAVVVMLLVTAYPLVNAVYQSLFSYRITAPEDRHFVGLGNYATALSDALFWQTVLTTLIITVATVGVELVIGFALAMVMHRAVFGRRTVRTAILLPYGIVTVISAFAWKYAFDVQSGFVNSWFGLGDFAWFSDRWAALFVIVLSEIWKTTPFVSLLLLAGLAQVPADLGEAATVDGATAWQRLKRVTIPNMKAAILVAVLFRTLDAWRIFDNVFIMTSGQEKTQVLSFLTYQQIITRTELGLGNAVGVLLFLSVVLIAAVFIKGFRVDLSQVRGDR